MPIEDHMTVERMIEILQALPNKKAKLYIWDPTEEVSGLIRDYVKDIHEPTQGLEVFIIADFG